MMERQVVAGQAIGGPVGVHPLAAQDFDEQLAGGFIIINHEHAHVHLMFPLRTRSRKKNARKENPERGTLLLLLLLVKWCELEALQHTVEGPAIDVENFGGPRYIPLGVAEDITYVPLLDFF